MNAHFPSPVNPAAPDRVTGGSSSGSAAAVAGKLADIAVGSDTGGSIRAPASFCGLIGLRTTHGRIPLDGAMPLAPSLDTFGWFADDIETYEAVGRILLGADAHRGSLTRPITMARLDALVVGRQEADAYERSRDIVDRGTGADETFESPFQSTMDELYWCLRRLQAYEAWQLHGAWIRAKPRAARPGHRGALRIRRDGRPQRQCMPRQCAASPSAPNSLEMLGKDGFLVLPTVPGAAPLKSAPQQELQAYRERALQAAMPVRPVGLSADHAAARHGRTARRSASRCSARRTATSR